MILPGDKMTHDMIEKRVVDSDGVELGVVSKVEDELVEVSEGLFDELLLSRSYISKDEGEEVILKNSLQNLLAGAVIIDSKGERLGLVKETINAGDILDSLILETEDKNLLFITLEEIYKIDKNITLDIDSEEVKYRQKTHTLMDHIKHYIEKIGSR